MNPTSAPPELKKLNVKFWAALRSGRRIEARIIYLLAKSKLQEKTMDPTNQPTNNGHVSKRGKKQKAAPGLAAPPIFLTPEQLSKLWAIAVGGQLTITTDSDTGLVICAVSLESFTQAMPLLLDRL